MQSTIISDNWDRTIYVVDIRYTQSLLYDIEEREKRFFFTN